MGPSSFNLDKIVLLYDVSHLLSLLFSFVRVFLQIRYLFTYIIKSVSIWRAVRHRSDKRGVWVLEGLHTNRESEASLFLDVDTYGILFLASKLARSLKVNPKVRIFAFIIFAGIFYGIDVEGYGESLDWQNDCLCLTINENLRRILVDIQRIRPVNTYTKFLSLCRQAGFAFIALKFLPTLPFFATSTNTILRIFL